MNFNKFQISIIVRVSALVLNCFALVFFVLLENFFYTSILLGFAFLIQAYKLVKHITKIHQYLTLFLRIIKESGDSYSLPARGTDYIFAELSLYFKEIREVIKDAKIEKENQYHYLQYVVEHVGIGLMAFDESGKVELFNNSGKKLLKIPTLLNIKTLDTLNKNFSSTLKELTPGQQKTFLLNIENELLHLSLKCAQFKMWDKKIKLVSFQNIKSELDEKELDSWQKLIRILNHEIMNSITPITTLTSSLKKSLVQDGRRKSLKEINGEIIDDTFTGLSLIEERGKGLIEFVNKYRSLSSALKANIQPINVNALINNVTTLLKPDIEKENIKLTIKTISENHQIYADESLIQQVLINLIKNSIQALQRKRNKEIIVRAYKSEGRTHIQIVDNGKGISREDMSNIFVPFYSTKEKGSGIGLSLSRQIMRLHKGTIQVNSVPNEQTTFTLTF